MFVDDGFLKLLAAEGLAIVPIEPTTAMLEACRDIKKADPEGYARLGFHLGWPYTYWKTMLAAAPKPTES